MVAIRSVAPSEYPLWDNLVRAYPDCSFFHGAAWATVLGRAYGHTPFYIAAMKENRLAGLLPVMEARSALFGSRGITLPFTDVCPALVSESVSADRLIQEAVGLGRAKGWKYIEFRGGNGLPEQTPPSVSFYSHRADLVTSQSRLFESLDSGTRRAIRKAEKSGVKVEVLNTQQSVQTYYDLHCLTRKRHGLPPQPLAFFRQIFENILAKGQGFVALATHEKKPIAGAVYFHLGDRAIYKYGASDLRFKEFRANNLVMWEAMRWCAAQGLASLDFGRTSIGNEGLRRFKLQFGAREEMIHYYRFDYRSNSFVVCKDNAEGWFNRFFGVMPIGMLRIIGSLLYKHMT